MSDDYSATNTQTTGTITVGGSATGNIESAGDVDWFAVTLQAGRTYRFALEGTATDAGTLYDPYLQGIHDSDGNLIAGTADKNSGEGRNALVTFTPTEGGTYYVSAGAWRDFEGTYRLSVTDLTAEDAHTAGTDTAGTVAVDGSVTGEIGYGGDLDWFAVTLEAGRTYRFDLEGAATDAGTLYDPYLQGIHDSNGNLIAGTADNNGGEGRNALVTFTPTEGGTYYVSAGARRDFEGTYRLSVTDLTAEDAHTAGTDTAGTVAVDGSVTGEIGHGGDLDWFAVTLEAGRTYRFSLEGSATDAGTLYDPHLRGIHDSNGNLIAGTADKNGGEGRNALVTFTPTEGGTYYVSAGARRDFEGTYRLSVTDTSVTDTSVTDTEELPPAFSDDGYAFDLAEHRDGSTNRMSLGTVLAADPDGDTVRYSLVGGNESGKFAIDESTGDLFYTGSGEDHEGVTSSYTLRVRADDGSLHSDVDVTLTVTAAEPPVFSEESYAFDLAENVDSSTDGLSLGTVSSTDRDGDAPVYSLAGGNESGKFAIDETTGELFYIGSGEDHEGVASSYTLRVRADDGNVHSDGSVYSDVNVTVTVTDAAEPPAFSDDGYAFDLAEHRDGSTNRMSLGTVLAADPDGDTVRYSLVGGNESGKFAIDESTGDLFYTGSGEDHEGVTSSYTLRVRADDGSLHSDVDVTLTVTAAEPPVFSEESYAFDLAENVDSSTDGLSLGTVAGDGVVDGPLDGDAPVYSLAGGNKSGKFAIDETTGELFYIGSGEDHEGVASSYTLRVRADDGNVHSDGSVYSDVNVTVTVTDAAEPPAFSDDGYAFDLAEHRDGSTNRMSLGTVLAADPDGDTVRYSLVGGNESGKFAIDESTGDLFYTGSGEDHEGVTSSYTLRVRADDGSLHSDVDVTLTVTAAEPPVFSEESYAFDLAENVDSSTDGLSLGTVSSTDRDGDAPVYSLAGGNKSGKFAIDETTGELFYIGSGEDHEGVASSYTLRVRADDGNVHSDGSVYSDVNVTVTVTDAAEPPAFSDDGYAFDLAEHRDGSTNRMSLGTVLAADPDGDTVRYSLVGGNESGKFAIDESTGDLFYTGSGEDHEGVTSSYTLRVRADDGSLHSDVDVTLTVTAAEPPVFSEESYAFDLAENVDSSTDGLSLGTVSSTDRDGDAPVYSLAGGNKSGKFAIDETTGELFYIGSGEDHEGVASSYTLRVRADDGNVHSDGSVYSDVNVTVTVTDAAEPPAFSDDGYAFDLAEHRDGSTNRMSLGTVLAADPDGDTVRYSLVGGNESGKFAIDESTGDLFYTGSGEDHEGVTSSYTLRVRADDGSLHSDVDVTLTVTAAEPPVFSEESYAFDLAENVDSSTDGLSLGTVSSTDRDGDAPVYSLAGGNKSGKFAIDETTGELFYIGSGEDHEGVASSYTLRVRADDGNVHSDGSVYSDVNVTVTVTDAAEPPAFSEDDGYGFVLSENADGSTNRVSLGAVSAVDPDGDRPVYSLAEGNESGRFAIDEATGELFYTGTGEDHESGTASYVLTVRASDGAHSTDTTVTVRVIDESVSEQAAEDFAQNAETMGRVLVDRPPVTGNIESIWDQDWYAVEFQAGRKYVIDYRGHDTSDGTLLDPWLYSVFGPDGNRIADTAAPGGGVGLNSRSVFTATRDGTHYVSTAGNGDLYSGTGTYELEVRDAAFLEAAFSAQSYTFSIEENVEGRPRVKVGEVAGTLQTTEDLVAFRIAGGNERGMFQIGRLTGVISYTGAGEDFESGPTSYELRVEALLGDNVVADRTVTVAVTDAAESPVFSEKSYAFDFAENADGSTNRLSLGTVSSTDPDGDAPVYSLAGGNESGKFAIDETTGELFYIGSGEDHEGVTSSYTLRVRADDGSVYSDVNVTVTVTDAAEPPAFSDDGYAFDLAEHRDGSTNRMSLGTVLAADPDGDTVRYSLVGGNESGKFAIDESTGDLFYTGSGEDHEGVTSSYTLRVRADDGSLHSDVDVTLTVTAAEPPVFSEESYAFDLAENVDSSTDGLSLGTVSSTDRDGDAPVYSLAGGNKSGKFAIDETTGELFYIGSGEDHEGVASSYTLRVRADDGNVHSDGSVYSDVNVTVTVTDAAEPPAFSDDGYAFDLAEHRDGSTNRILLGAVTATDPEGGTVRYSLEGSRNLAGMASSGRLFEVDPVTGAVFYTGSGENFDQGAPEYELIVRASDGDHSFSDTRVRVNIADVQGVSEEEGEDLIAGTNTTGKVVVGEGFIDGNLRSNTDRDWYKVDLNPGVTYRFQVNRDGEPSDSSGSRSRSVDNGGTAPSPEILAIRDSEGNPFQGIVRGEVVEFTPTADSGTTWYLEVGSQSFLQGSRSTDTRDSGDSARKPPGDSSVSQDYRITAREASSDDYADDTTTAAVTGVGYANRGSGTINTLGDKDWFKVELEAGHRYSLRVDDGERDAAGHHTGISGIYDSTGAPLYVASVRDRQDGNHTLIFGDLNHDDPTKNSAYIPGNFKTYGTGTETYYIEVTSRESTRDYSVWLEDHGSHRDDYVFSGVNVLDIFSYAAFPAVLDNAGRLDVGGSVTGNILWQVGKDHYDALYDADGNTSSEYGPFDQQAKSETDAIGVTLQGGKTYQFELAGTGSNPVINPHIWMISRIWDTNRSVAWNATVYDPNYNIQHDLHPLSPTETNLLAYGGIDYYEAYTGWDFSYSRMNDRATVEVPYTADYYVFIHSRHGTGDYELSVAEIDAI